MFSQNADILAFKLINVALNNPNFPFYQGVGSEEHNARYIVELTKKLSAEIQQKFDDFNVSSV